MGMHELSALLWRERELLEALHFKLEVEQLLLAAGKTRWLSRATQETEQVTARLKEVGLARTVEATAVAAEWGAPEDATLRQLSAASPDTVWTDILDSHFAGLASVVSRIEAVRDENVRLLRAMNRDAQETLATLEPFPIAYDAQGAASSRSDARIVDREA